MLLKILIGVLALLVVTASEYIVLSRNPVNRFKPIDQDGYVAFDTATGQLCKTFRTKTVPEKIQSIPSSDRSNGSRPVDPILDAIRGGVPDAQAEQAAQVQFIRGLPACADIR